MTAREGESQKNEFSGHADGWVIQAGTIGQIQIQLSERDRMRLVPRDLPRAPLRLINRQLEMESLDRILDESTSAPGPVVAILSGMRGVGKSATGSHWANRVRQRFADGDLSVDFASLRRDGAVSLSEVLADLIRTLESPEFAIPPTFAERVRTFGRITASRRLLLFLDDVTVATEVESLLPHGAGSVVVVTSNFHLEKLIHDGASLIAVEPLAKRDSLELLRKMCGDSRIDDEPAAVERLLEFCGGLPVALCVCGSRLVKARGRTLSWFVDEIEGKDGRLDGLAGKGGSVQAVFDSAYVALDPHSALVYRRLGDHPGREVSGVHIAALANLSVAEAEAGLETLEDANLVEASSNRFFRQHDLLRMHARERAESEESLVLRDECLRRLVDWYEASIYQADRTIGLDRLRISTPESNSSALGLPDLDSAQAVFTWFDAERANLMAVLREAAKREWDDTVWRMAESMWLMLLNRQLYEDWAETMKLGVEAAGRCRNKAAEARLRTLLARAYQDRGELERALAELRAALSTAESVGHERLVASIHEFIGSAYMAKREYPRAISEFEISRDFFVAHGLRRGTALQDLRLGSALTVNGEARRALPRLHSAVQCMADVGDELNLAKSLLGLGRAQRADGDPEQAQKALHASLEISVPLGVRHIEAQAQEVLAEIATERGDRANAAFHRHYAYLAYAEIGNFRAAALLDEPSPSERSAG